MTLRYAFFLIFAAWAYLTFAQWNRPTPQDRADQFTTQLNTMVENTRIELDRATPEEAERILQRIQQFNRTAND